MCKTWFFFYFLRIEVIVGRFINLLTEYKISTSPQHLRLLYNLSPLFTVLAIRTRLSLNKPLIEQIRPRSQKKLQLYLTSLKYSNKRKLNILNTVVVRCQTRPFISALGNVIITNNIAGFL